MNRYFVRFLILGLLFGSQAEAALVVKGVASNCEIKNALLPFMDVYIFDSAKVPRLVRLIKTLDTRKEDPGGKLFPQWFAEVKKLVKGTKPLVHTKTNRAGSFKTEIPRVQNIVVFSYADLDDVPFYYAYRRVAISGRSSIDIVLEFGNDSCQHAHDGK
jgi:hypothetical protein